MQSQDVIQLKIQQMLLQLILQCVKVCNCYRRFNRSVVITTAPSFSWPEQKPLNLTYETDINDWFVQASYLNKTYEQPVYKALNTGDPLMSGFPQVPTLKSS